MPTRRKQGGTPAKVTTVTEDQVIPSEELAALWQRQYPEGARRFGWLQQQVLFPQREAPVNPSRTDISNPEEMTQQIKDYARQLGADDVGIAEYVPELTFADRELLPHTHVIAFALKMEYDLMADIGPNSQHEVHRVYFKMLDIGVQLAQYIGSFGYSARAHPNGGELPHIPYGYLSGLGELGKHGSLISSTLGSSVRLSLVSTDMPLVVDGPQDYGIDDMCTRCNICTKFCPGDAISPDKQTVKGVNRWYVDTEKCFPYFESLWGCKICLMVCPFNGRTLTNKESYKDIAREMNKAKTKEGLLRYLAAGTPEAKDNPVLVQFLEDPV